MPKKSTNGKVEIEELDWSSPDLFQETEGEGKSDHPALELWRHPGLLEILETDIAKKYLGLLFLMEKAAIPERMVDVYSRALYFTIKYNSTSMALRMLSDLVVRLGSEGQARTEYLKVLAVITQEDKEIRQIEAETEARHGDKD